MFVQAWPRGRMCREFGIWHRLGRAVGHALPQLMAPAVRCGLAPLPPGTQLRCLRRCSTKLSSSSGHCEARRGADEAAGVNAWHVAGCNVPISCCKQLSYSQ